MTIPRHDAGAEFPIAWALFTRMELATQRDLADVADFFEVAVAEVGLEGLLRGWALVAAVLRLRLQEHASKLGSDVGSDDWLRREQIHHAGAS